MRVRCMRCGWQGDSQELAMKTVYEDFGDVSCAACPGCGAIEYDGMELFLEADDDDERRAVPPLA